MSNGKTFTILSARAPIVEVSGIERARALRP